MTQPQIPEEPIRLLTAEPIKPSKKQWLGSAIGAILFPRGAGAFLTSPIQWAQTQTAIRQSQAREALNALLKIAGLNVEQMKATAPVEAARVREEGATARQREQMEAIEKPKLSLEERRLEEIEKPRAEAEKARTEALTAETVQKTALSPKERYTRLVERYAEYLGSERYTPQGDEAFRRALSMLGEQIGAEPPAAVESPQPSPAQEKTKAEAQLTQERAKTESELREPKKEQIKARTALIKAETLLTAKRREEIDANITALRQRVSQGWANVQLRAQGLALAKQSADNDLLAFLVKNASISAQNIDTQINELRKAKAQLQYPMSGGGVGMPAYDVNELDAMIRELQQQKQANQGIVELGNLALQQMKQRIGK